MDGLDQKLYSELRNTSEELKEKLSSDTCSESIRAYLEAELHDTEQALKKMKNGTFGICEISGELIPPDLLYSIPTIRTLSDSKQVSDFYIKPFFS
jgi:RNA polymerase-binding transcription factor DksA